MKGQNNTAPKKDVGPGCREDMKGDDSKNWGHGGSTDGGETLSPQTRLSRPSRTRREKTTVDLHIDVEIIGEETPNQSGYPIPKLRHATVCLERLPFNRIKAANSVANRNMWPNPQKCLVNEPSNSSSHTSTHWENRDKEKISRRLKKLSVRLNKLSFNPDTLSRGSECKDTGGNRDMGGTGRGEKGSEEEDEVSEDSQSEEDDKIKKVPSSRKKMFRVDSELEEDDQIKEVASWGRSIVHGECKRPTRSGGRERATGSSPAGGCKKTRRQSPSSSESDESEDTESEDESPDWRPKTRSGKSRGNYQDVNWRRSYSYQVYKTANMTSGDYVKPDQILRENTIRSIMERNLDIEGYCLCCGTTDVDIPHPLFKGGLCMACKDNFSETTHCYDVDGYQSYCTICCYGEEVLLCGHDSCYRAYCKDCLNILVGPGSYVSFQATEPWLCFFCEEDLRAHGALVPREDWSMRFQTLFANNSAMEFEPHRMYPSIPANLRKPIRVLSLFDGIATGIVVLKELGIKVELYMASEIDKDCIAVADYNHGKKITRLTDVRYITKENLKEWGPFDLLIGGSPCNDLSMVNPTRKGLYEGSGRLFFDYYRILNQLKPKEDDPRPFFWLFENVVCMGLHDKHNISRYLECDPVVVDAVKVSPAVRKRHFWGNIPGMNRPMTAAPNGKVNLQDCLEMNRKAMFKKVRTITTATKSLKQGKDYDQFPVIDDGKEDIFWSTEIEQIFGFPKHYTDVRNLGRQQRLNMLGRSWSVPAVRHLLAPLKDYFEWEEVPMTMTTAISTSIAVASSSYFSNTSSSSSTASSSPASPDSGV